MVDVTEIKVDGYECVVRGIDEKAGLHGLIAVHDTTLGPALGGLRMWTYGSEEEALTDVTRLARGMTYKSALARTGLGGGKAVIIGDSRSQKTPGLFHAVGELINYLDGRYITAEDVGIKVADLDRVAEVSRWVSGRALENGGSGNPSPYTAHGTFVGLKACLEDAFDSGDFKDRVFAIQGVGAVAKTLARSIEKEGGRLVVCDVNQDNVAWSRENLSSVEVVEPDAIYDVECDVFVPCALGAILNDDTIPRLKAKAIGGCANNQLKEVRHAEELLKRGILYAPDYVINAGGIINVSCEFQDGGYDESAAIPKIDNIYQALKEIFKIARDQGITTRSASDHIAEKRLAEGRAG